MKVKLLISLVVVLLVMSGNGFLWSKSDKKRSEKVGRTSASSQTNRTLVNIGQLAMWIFADGTSANRPNGNSGLFFPRGTINNAAVVFQDGFIWGGLVNDDVSPALRVGGQTYSIGTVPGSIISQGVAEDFSDPAVNRIWRVRRDYATADLLQDAAEINGIPGSAVSNADIAAVRTQYESDWRDWPAEKGAPFYDAESNGLYDPQFNSDGTPRLFPEADEPGIADADQVVWTVANDLNQAVVHSLYGSPPIGLEMQLTLWGYFAEGMLSNVIFKRYRLIYKGTDKTPVTAFIDSMYFCQWSDPDLGAAGDDLVGSDTTLSLGYVYNNSLTDAVYSTIGLPPPAAGYDFLQGPIVPSAGNSAIFNFKERPGFRNLPMTTFAFFGGIGSDSDPIRGGDYNGTLQWWNLLRGFRPRPESPPNPWRDPAGQITKFRVPGDPVTGTGWIDSNPGDKSLLLASGPFTMVLGDTQEVVIGLMAGLGASHILSISELKKIDRATQILFDNSFVLVLAALDVSVFYESATATRVFISANIAQPATSVEVTLTDAISNVVGSLSLFDDGAHNDGAAGDGVFANELTLPPQQTPLDINVSIQTTSNTLDFEKFSKVTTAGAMEISGFMVASDHINIDGKINPGENVRLTASLHNGSTFDFSQVTAIFDYAGPVDFRDDIDQIFSNVNAGQTIDVIYDPAAATTYTNFQVSQNAQGGDTIRVNITMTDLQGNRWSQKLALKVNAFDTEPGNQTTIDHVSGKGDGDFSSRIVEPSLVTGHTYQVQIIEPADENDVFGFDLVDLDESETLLSDHPLPDEFSHNIPLTDGFKLFGANFDETTKIVTFRSAAQTFDADPADAGLTLWGDSNLFGLTTDLYNEFGNGVPSPPIDILQRDILLRFTGITDTGDWFGVVTGGGQWSTQWQRASFACTEDSSTDPCSQYARVPVRLPFEIWDIENDRQINVAVINRNADGASPYGNDVGDPNTPGMEPRWRITGRDYWIPIWTDYDADPNSTKFHNDPNTSWLLFFTQGGASTWTTGDVFKIEYPNPLTSADVYRFSVITGIEEQSGTVNEFRLFQNYPNPFNPETIIRYQLPKAGRVMLMIYNVLGQQVRTLVNKNQTSGKYSIIWDGKNNTGESVSSGVYFYKLTAGESFLFTRKMLFLK